MNYKHCCVINAAGYYQTVVLVQIPDGEDQQIQGYTLKSGESLIDVARPSGFIRPKWGTKVSTWQEGATAKEIAAWEAEHPGKTKTLAEVQADKLAQINAWCDAAITAGCDVTLSGGTEGHISLTLPDQINLSTAQAAILGGGTGYAYHLDGALCEVYSAEDIAIMATAATAHILYHQTYCNHAWAWAKRCETVAEVQAITYGAELPEDLAAHMVAVLAAAEGGDV